MKIVVIEGSPKRNGSSNLLASEFIRGAEEAGHTVRVTGVSDGPEFEIEGTLP